VGVTVSDDLQKLLSETKDALNARTLERDNALKGLQDKVSELDVVNLGLARSKTQLELVSKTLESKEVDLSLTQEKLSESNVALFRQKEQLQHVTQLLESKDEESRSSQIALEQGEVELKSRSVDLVERTAQLASSALELSRITAELVISNEAAVKKTIELELRNQQLSAANEELNELLRQRDDFVSSLTHDLKNPLIGVNRILEAIISGVVEPDEQMRLLQQIHSSNNFMLHMIWNLLDTYKHHSGALRPQFTDVNLVALLHAILSEFSFHMESKRQTTKMEIQASFPYVRADTILLRRALFNLVDNAIKFTPEEGCIQVSGEFDKDMVKLSIQDSGTGISFEQREKLFQQFWQGRRGGDNQIGTGLGLYLTKNIVELHGGKLDCSSSDGQGATFTISLPRKQS